MFCSGCKFHRQKHYKTYCANCFLTIGRFYGKTNDDHLYNPCNLNMPIQTICSFCINTTIIINEEFTKTENIYDIYPDILDSRKNGTNYINR